MPSAAKAKPEQARETYVVTTHDLIRIIVETLDGGRAEVVGVLADVPETVGSSRRAVTLVVQGNAYPLEARKNEVS
jgi:hypothetical protein